MNTSKTLCEAMISVQYSNQWGVWAEVGPGGKFDGQTMNWRYGQCQFENGGRLDEYEFVGNGEYLLDKINSFQEGMGEDEKGIEADMVSAELLLDEINADRE